MRDKNLDRRVLRVLYSKIANREILKTIFLDGNCLVSVKKEKRKK